MRVLLDANVLVSALLSKVGAPARLLVLWSQGELELVVCPTLLGELERILTRPRIRSRIDPAEAERFVALLEAGAESVPDPEDPPVRSVDPDDDYLLALAAREQVPLVSGDSHLLALRGRTPIFSPREFLERLG